MAIGEEEIATARVDDAVELDAVGQPILPPGVISPAVFDGGGEVPRAQRADVDVPQGFLEENYFRRPDSNLLSR